MGKSTHLDTQKQVIRRKRCTQNLVFLHTSLFFHVCHKEVTTFGYSGKRKSFRFETAPFSQTDTLTRKQTNMLTPCFLHTLK